MIPFSICAEITGTALAGSAGWAFALRRCLLAIPCARYTRQGACSNVATPALQDAPHAAAELIMLGAGVFVIAAGMVTERLISGGRL
jgi:hypothetical protein